MLHDSRLAADHHAIAALQAPHATAGADVDVMNVLRGELLGATDVVHVVRVAAVDQNVAGFEQGNEVGNGLVDGCRRHSLEPVVDHVFDCRDLGGLCGGQIAVPAEHLRLERAAVVERQNVQLLVEADGLHAAPFIFR